MPLPRAMAVPLEYILNHDLIGLIKSDKSNLRKLKSLVDEATKLSLQLDTASLRYEASRKINRCMDKIKNSPDDIKTLELVDGTVETLLTLTSDLDLQHAQNILFALSRQMYPDKVKKTESGDKSAKKWIDTISRLAQHLGVKI
ncbi:MAG: hypothetical protein E4H40_07580 [Candidatus Brocadiia bacterium]|nr:MAG: hypothetical protein E4H40_07580 [Candidatus Brocadiia bacterium]